MLTANGCINLNLWAQRSARQPEVNLLRNVSARIPRAPSARSCISVSVIKNVVQQLQQPCAPSAADISTSAAASSNAQAVLERGWTTALDGCHEGLTSSSSSSSPWWLLQDLQRFSASTVGANRYVSTLRRPKRGRSSAALSPAAPGEPGRPGSGRQPPALRLCDKASG